MNHIIHQLFSIYLKSHVSEKSLLFRAKKPQSEKGYRDNPRDSRVLQPKQKWFLQANLVSAFLGGEI